MSNKTKTENVEKKVTVIIPKQSRTDTERYIAVNGERILVKTGIPVEVPERFADVINNSESMLKESVDFIDANISE